MKKIYMNGPIITMEDNSDHEIISAVVTEDERIIFVGDSTEAEKKYEQVEKVDLQGATMLPAFIDAHSHLSSTAGSLLQVNLDETASLEEIAKRIEQFITAKDIQPGTWIVAKGYDHNELEGNQHPDKYFLDAICKDNPIALQHASGHVGVFNSMALSLLSITSVIESPEGGTIDFDKGYMEENAFFKYFKMVPMPDMPELMAAYAKAQELYASYGITTIQEGYAVKEMIPLYQYLTANRLLKLDVVLYSELMENAPFYQTFQSYVNDYQNHMRIGGYKIFLDGSPQGRTAWMRTPYLAEEEDYFGYGTMTDSRVQEAIETAALQKQQILAHCNGDAAAQQYLAAIRKVTEAIGTKPIRPVMIHAQLLGVDQLEEVKYLGVIPSFFIAHVYYWGDIHISNFGKERANQISPARSALDKGILFTFHQDTPVIAPNMLETIWCAVNRRTKSGVLLGKDECIDVYTALKAVTINAAFQYGEENQKGSLTVGKKADFVILDENPLTADRNEIKDIRILQTIKDGQVIYKDT